RPIVHVAPEYALGIATSSTRMGAIFPRLLPSPPNCALWTNLGTTGMIPKLRLRRSAELRERVFQFADHVFEHGGHEVGFLHDLFGLFDDALDFFDEFVASIFFLDWHKPPQGMAVRNALQRSMRVCSRSSTSWPSSISSLTWSMSDGTAWASSVSR